MPAPFTLDVDAAAVGRFGTHVGELATELRAKGERAAETSARPAVAAWEGDAASSIKPEMTGLGNLLCTYSNDLVLLSEAVGRFVTAIGTAEEELAALDTAWRRADEVHAEAVAEAGSAHTSALRDAGRNGAELDQGTEQRLRGLHAGALRDAAGTRQTARDGLEADHAEIRERVARAARALSASLVATTPIEVPPVALAAWQADGTTPSYDFDPGLLLFGLSVTRDFRAQENPTADLELRLREEGLLTGPAPSGAYLTWLENAVENGVDPDVVVEIAEDHDITPGSFDVLDGLEAVTDRDGKTFYLLPTDISGDDARRATILTYILNAGTGYGDADGSEDNDFPETPYSSDEVQRILDRQAANDWSYDDDVDFVHGNGGRLATTPNGMMMGLGGNWIQDRFSLNGGTAWGDVFMINIDGPSGDDAAQALREAIQSGRATYEDDDGGLYHGDLDLDRLLHHEEIHSQQWAEHGHAGFIARYLASAAWNLGDPTEMGFEQDAGLSDGGYE